MKRDNSEQLQNTDNKTPGPNTKHSHSGHIITAGNCERVYFVYKVGQCVDQIERLWTSVRRREIDVEFWPFSDDACEYMRFITGRPRRPRDVYETSNLVVW